VRTADSKAPTARKRNDLCNKGARLER
jgi:hypothetical protein